MKLFRGLLSCVLVLLLPVRVLSALPPASEPLPNFDNRVPAPESSEVASEHTAAVSELRTSVPNAKVDFTTVSLAPKFVSSPDGFLSGPEGIGGGIATPNLLAIPVNDSNRVTKAFLNEHRALFGHGGEALDQAQVRRDFVTPNNGMRTVVWEQQVDGIPVFEAVLVSHVTRRNELVNISSQFVPTPDQAANRGNPTRALLQQSPTITAQEAVAIAARNVGENAAIGQITSSGAAAATAEKNERFTAPFLRGEAEAKLIWLPMDRDTLRLCWDVTLISRTRGEMYRVLVDAETGAVQIRNCLTNYLQDASYRVFTSDSPSPFSPGYPTPVSTQPPLISRTLVTTPGLDLTASPNGWINDGGNETLGNNVDAHTDRNDDDLPDLPRPQGSPFRVFDFPMDLTTQNPTNYSQAAVVQLFYWNNFMHDKLYELGFTEAAGNFQSNNFGRGGLGNDAVQADAQDGGGFNNANFSTPPDGSAGRMQMYIFSGPTPQRDGDFDAEVVLHEYTHGLSNRRVGGGVGISALQPSGMGEGWSDFYALSLLSEAGDDVNGVYAAGGYATFGLSGMTQNYYFGIRRYPYCTDMTKNPLTFKDIDPAQASTHTGIPRSAIIGTTANEVHNMGEVWCVTLWEARAKLINAYGWAVGNQLMLQLVTDGMNLSPANPTFLQARDAIIQADLVDNGGANRNLLWAAFAKRGMGASATSPASSTTSGLVEAYDVPDVLQIIPATLSSAGPVGGPFTPNPAFFTITNSTTNSLTWSLANTASWITVSPTNGTLNANSSATISVTVSSSATNFPLGTTNAIIWFTNQTSGIAQSRTFSLSVVGRSLFENFEPGVHVSLWSSFGGILGSTVIATNYGGSISGINSLWFGDAGSRFAATIPVNTSGGGSISFYLRLGNGLSAPWETVDLPTEGIVLEYSTNNGATWTTMGTYDTTTFYNWTQVVIAIPVGALSPATQFRWRQLTHSGSCCDHWALDDISIDAGPTPPSITIQPTPNQTVKSGTSVTFSVLAQGSFPLYYQWSKDGTNLQDSGRISGSTSATVNISTALESDSGQYLVVVTNIYGAVTSSIATLLVTPLDHFEWATIPSPQAAGTPFNAAITAKDFLNATITNYNGSVNLSAAGSGPGEVYRADFESGLQGFTITNTFGLGNGLWHLSTGRGNQTGHSAINSVYFGTGEGPNGGGTYNTGTAVEGVMVSPLIDLSTVSGPLTLSFNTVIQSEPGTAWDHATFEVSTNNGATYVTLASNNQGGNMFGTDSSNLWITVSNDFSAYAGSQVRLRLHFNTLDAGVNAFEGWYVDDIVIRGPSTPVSISPSSTGNFTNGIWSGVLTVPAPASNIVVRADDNSGHVGLSNPFDVLLQNDISITMADAPDPVPAGSNLTYTITVANAGPNAATGVTVTNVLPAGVAFVSVNSSQGTSSQSGGVVAANLGTLTGNSQATVTVVVVPTAAGTLTNSATASRAEADAFPGNNSATVVTQVRVPAISINDVSVLEGNFGTTSAIFTVSLNSAGGLPISISYATADGTAVAGTDYVATNGTLVFAPGETNKQIVVAVKGDTLGEADETFFVNLNTPVNVTLNDAQGVGTILSDDLPSAVYLRSTAGAPWSSTSNETAMNRVFGSNNWQDLRYETVNLGSLLSPTTTFIYMEGSDTDATEMENFLTANIVAIQNWVSNGGSLFLNAAPNEDNGMSFGFGVTLVYPDMAGTGGAVVPAHPIFNGPFTPVGTSWTGSSFGHATVTGAGLTALITNALNGNIVLGEEAYGVGHVLFGGMTTDNFHSPQPQASALRANIIAYLSNLAGYHFEWSQISSPELINVPIPVTITAKDATGMVYSNFNGTVAFSAIAGSNSIPMTPANSGTFTNGVWSGTVSVAAPATGIVLISTDNIGRSGSSNPFDELATNDLVLTMTDSPDPVPAGVNLVYSLTIANSGPNAATGITLTNTLPANATFVSATTSQGTWVQTNGLVIANLGTIAGGANASVSITVVATNSGVTITNTATVYRVEADAFLGNNTATVATAVTPPTITIGDASVVEGNLGTTQLLFPVTLAAPSAQIISVDFATADGSAVVFSDYINNNGVLTFAPGVTNQQIVVTVVGDVTIEPNENLFVNLSNPVNALIARAQATGTIINDDGLPGELFSLVWDPIGSLQTQNQPFSTTITVRDGLNAVVTNFNGTLLLSSSIATGPTNTILSSPDYTGWGTGDYTLGYSFTLTTNVTVTHVRHYFGTKVSIWTDDGNLLGSQDVTSVPGTWTQTRLNTPLRLTNGVTYRVTVHSSSSTNYSRGDLGNSIPYGTIVKSYEAFGDTFPTQEDPVRWWFVDLRYTVGFDPISPIVTGTFTNGIWSGNMTVQSFGTNLTLRADDGYAHVGFSNPFNVIGTDQPPVIITAPTNTSVYLSSVATFNVSATGVGPLSYQWRFNGVDIPNATNATLTISRVLLSHAGSYAVVVSNPFGSASSGKVTLSIVQVVAWGAGTNTAISSPNYMQSIVPPGLTNVTRLAGGIYHSIAAGADGKVRAWGAGTNVTQVSPNYGQSIVPQIGNVIAVAGGGYHTLALRDDGTMAGWGAGTNVIFGTAPNYQQSVIPPAASNVVAIAAGDYHSVALRTDGRVVVWGNNSFGQTNVPVAATNVIAVASRGNHVLVLRNDGYLLHWGNLTTVPLQTSNYVAIAAGVNHGLALRNDGVVVAIGGQYTVPFGLSNVVEIAAGLDQSLALKSDGTVVTWGATNTFGRGSVPPGLSNVVGIACGSYNSLAYLGDGSPVIKYHPLSRPVFIGNSTTFSVLAVGSQLRYQWQRNGTNVPGATNFTLTVNAQPFNSGGYRAIITNAYGAVTSSVANLILQTQLGVALDSPGNQTWLTSGNGLWFGEFATTHDGVDAAQSGPITDNQQSTLQSTFTGPGVLTFWWKVSSEQFFDTLGFTLDAVQKTNISGEVNWQQQTWSIGAGPHTVKWTYQKDSSGSNGLDTAWLDQVVFTPDPPIFTSQPSSQTNSMGATVIFSVTTLGVSPITYQWYKFGTNPVGDGISPVLTITNATRHDSGIYSVVATNPGGSTLSSNAVVLIHVPQHLTIGQQPGGTFVLTSGDADGGLLSSMDITNLEPQVSSNLVDWVTMTNSLTLTNGTLIITDPAWTNYPSRFYRVIEH